MRKLGTKAQIGFATLLSLYGEALDTASPVIARPDLDNGEVSDEAFKCLMSALRADTQSVVSNPLADACREAVIAIRDRKVADAKEMNALIVAKGGKEQSLYLALSEVRNVFVRESGADPLSDDEVIKAMSYLGFTQTKRTTAKIGIRFNLVPPPASK